eukprot:30839-Pelagococcus_subviridis.AAC.2
MPVVTFSCVSGIPRCSTTDSLRVYFIFLRGFERTEKEASRVRRGCADGYLYTDGVLGKPERRVGEGRGGERGADAREANARTRLTRDRYAIRVVEPAREDTTRARARARPATTLARNLSVKAPGERKRVPESGGHLPQRHRVQLPLRALLRQRRLVHRDPRPVLKVRAHGLEPREVAAVEERADVPEDVVAQREEPRRALVLRAVPREEVLPPRERAALHRARGDVFGRLRVRRRRARRRVAQGSVTQHVARGGRPCEKN